MRERNVQINSKRAWLDLWLHSICIHVIGFCYFNSTLRLRGYSTPANEGHIIFQWDWVNFAVNGRCGHSTSALPKDDHCSCYLLHAWVPSLFACWCLVGPISENVHPGTRVVQRTRYLTVLYCWANHLHRRHARHRRSRQCWGYAP